MEVLKKDILSSVRKNAQIIAALADVTGKSIDTVIRYIRENNVILTTKSCLDVIRKGLNKKDNEVITEIKKEEVEHERN